MTKHFTLANILTGVFTIIIVSLLKWGYSILLNTDFLHFDLKESVLLGSTALVTRLSIKGYIEDFIIPLITNKFGYAYLGGNDTLIEQDVQRKSSNIAFMDSASNNQSNSGSSSEASTSRPSNSGTQSNNYKPYYDARDSNQSTSNNTDFRSDSSSESGSDNQ